VHQIVSLSARLPVCQLDTSQLFSWSASFSARKLVHQFVSWSAGSSACAQGRQLARHWVLLWVGVDLGHELGSTAADTADVWESAIAYHAVLLLSAPLSLETEAFPANY